MAVPHPSWSRKSSTPGDRLKPVKQDPLVSMGFVSKGDTRLLDLNSQESFYQTITARYMAFCTQHSNDLDHAFASLSLNENISASSDPARNPPTAAIPSGTTRPLNLSGPQRNPSPLRKPPAQPNLPSPSTELSTVLLALRKLREGLLASSSAATSPAFSQRVHVFNIRVALLARHPPSYHPSLLHLLFVLHSKQHPLPPSELVEMTTYLILDLACRQRDLAGAYALRLTSHNKFGYRNRTADAILAAISNGNWVSFWRLRRKADGYIRAVLHWQVEHIRRAVLKAIGRAYLGCDVQWILQSATGGEMSWEELVETEDLGWIRDGEKVSIRKPKQKATVPLS